jgi:hypothetical protein
MISIYSSFLILFHTLTILFIKFLYRFFIGRLTNKIDSFKIVCKFLFLFKTILVISIPTIYIFLNFLLLLLSFFLSNVVRSFLIVRKVRLKYKFAKILSPAIYNVRIIYFAGYSLYFSRFTFLFKYYRDLITLYHRFPIFQRPILITQAKLQFSLLYERRKTGFFNCFNFMEIIRFYNSTHRNS